MLTTYQELQESIAEQKAGLEADMEELLALKEDMQQKQDSVNSLIGQTKANIAQTNQDLEDAKENVSDLDAKLQKMIEYEKQLELQKAQEDAARLAAIKAQEQEDTSGVVYVPTDSDAYLLGAIIQCESDGEPYEGKLAVGSVVLNRVRSSYFPNTISGVIYQSGQFSPVASGRLAYRLEAGVNGTCLQAAQEVLNGNITLNCLYFRTNNGIISGTVIGNHVFY
jgi:spore germination cell wall hydrolase CwlJ-like protein